MFIKHSCIAVVLALLTAPVVSGQSHFKRFPATVTNDGAYVLAWGLKDNATGHSASKTEIPTDGPKMFDILSKNFDADDIEDYLVDTATGKIVATIANFGYFAGSEGSQNRTDLEVGWSPDNRGGIAIYQERYSTGAIAWINPADHKVSNVWPQIEKAIRRIVVQKKGKRVLDECSDFRVSNAVFARPRRLVLDAEVANWDRKDAERILDFSFRITFSVKGNLDAPQLELAGAKSLSEDSEPSADDQDVEAELNKVYHKLAATLPPRDHKNLKQEQVKWLDTRDHSIDGDKGFFTHRRIRELKARGGEL